MANFAGYLIKNASGAQFPNHCIIEYKSNPNQQQDSGSWVDSEGYLHRVILPHTRSKLWITTKRLKYAEKTAIQSVFGSNFGAARESVNLTYWNDEINDYSTADFYIPDIDWTIILIDDKGQPIYEGIELTLIEY